MPIKQTCSFVLALALGFAMASEAHATDIPANTWTTTWDTMVSVYPTDIEYVIILNQHTYAGHTGDCNGGRQFYILASDPNYEEKARTLLAAFLAGREVLLYWDTSGPCRAHINRFQVR